MFSWLGYFNSELENANQSFEQWEIWQQKQSKAHYIESYLGIYIPPKPGYKNLYFRYCFGDFENLIYMPETCNDLNYFSLIISTYDKCKGYLRSIKGDASGIYLLRKVVMNKNCDDLYNHDFNIYNYNYSRIHAHTVAQFSLSTLLMLFVSNYMHFKSYNSDHFPHIDVELCKNAYNTKVFGDITYVNPSKSVIRGTPVAIKKSEGVTRNCNSWPGPIHNLPKKCLECGRQSENFWGQNKHCLDCHLYKVCLICGGQLFTIGKDNYPRCIVHQNL